LERKEDKLAEYIYERTENTSGVKACSIVILKIRAEVVQKLFNLRQEEKEKRAAHLIL